MSKQQVRTCIIPAAGKGTRWEPISKYIPKEMIPLGGQATIEYTVREAIDSGIKKVIVVINPQKEIIKDYLLKQLKSHKDKLEFVYQNKPQGIAETILLSGKFIKNEPFAFVFPDMPSLYKTPPLRQLINSYKSLNNKASLISFAKYPAKNTLFYGEFLLGKKSKGLFKVIHLCPRAKTPKDAHHKNSKLRGAGRYILSSRILPLVEECLKNNQNREINDGEILSLAIERNHNVLGQEIDGHIFDVGTPKGYGQAFPKFSHTCILNKTVVK